MSTVHIDESFDKIDFVNTVFSKGEYDSCKFSNCNFLNVDLSDSSFVECEFINCNLSMAKILRTAFRDVLFKDTKMMGLRFDNCNQSGFSFTMDNCTLNHSSFHKNKLRKTIFRNSQLREVDFTDSDFTSSVFDNCDLASAIFENSILEKVDFTTSFNYTIHPESNRIKKAKFSMNGIIGLLSKYDIVIEHSNS